jgi:hypothetical protein
MRDKNKDGKELYEEYDRAEVHMVEAIAHKKAYIETLRVSIEKHQAELDILETEIVEEENMKLKDWIVLYPDKYTGPLKDKVGAEG